MNTLLIPSVLTHMSLLFGSGSCLRHSADQCDVGRSPWQRFDRPDRARGSAPWLAFAEEGLRSRRRGPRDPAEAHVRRTCYYNLQRARRGLSFVLPADS